MFKSLKNCYCHVETHQKPLKLSPLREILDVRRAKPQSEPPGLDFTQHSPVQRCDSLPILHSKFLDKKGCKITQSCPFCFPLFFFCLVSWCLWWFHRKPNPEPFQKQTRFEQTPALFEMTQPHRGKGKLSIRQVRAWWCVCDTMLPISFWMFLIVFVALDGCYLGCACSLVIQVVIKCDNHWRREPAQVIIWSCVIMSQCLRCQAFNSQSTQSIMQSLKGLWFKPMPDTLIHRKVEPSALECLGLVWLVTRG